MRLDKKIIKGLGEYFFGFETKKELCYQKAFYIEFITNRDVLEGFLYQFDKVEDKYITLSKYLPLIIEETGVITSLITNRYEWAMSGIISGNFLRIAMLHWNPAKNGRKALEETINSLDNGKSLEENALRMLEHSGHRKEVDDYKDLNDNP